MIYVVDCVAVMAIGLEYVKYVDSAVNDVVDCLWIVVVE